MMAMMRWIRDINDPGLVDRAVAFATLKHRGQFRKGTTIPYITHAVEALAIVSRMTEDAEVRAAAVLHDTLEDTDTTKKELIRNFGERVAALVAAESEDKREDQPAEETWLTRKQETIKHLSNASPNVKMIALGDKLSNIRAMHRDYEEIGEKLWERFNEKDPVKQGMYYGSVANVFGKDEVISKTAEYREYVKLVSEVFGSEYEYVDGKTVRVEDEEEHEDSHKWDCLRPANYNQLKWFHISGYPYHVADKPDGSAEGTVIQEEIIKDYGEKTELPDGTVLHGNHGPYEGGRQLVRCRDCGGLFLKQSTDYMDIYYDGPEMTRDWIPVASETEANLLNILLNDDEFENYPVRHLRSYNSTYLWAGEDEPKASDAEDLKVQIRKKYPQKGIEELIQRAMES